MGASKEKKEREIMREQGLSPREKAELEAKEKERKTRTKYIIIAIAVVIVAALAILINSSVFTNSLPAYRVDDTNYTLAEANYAYQSAYTTFYNQNQSYINLFFDPQTPLNKQDCPLDENGGTWHDYFKKAAASNLEQNKALYDAAVKAGYGVTDEILAEVDSTMSQYSLYAAYSGTTLDAFLAGYFGAGNNEKTLRSIMEKQLVINAYLDDVKNSLSYTDAELDAVYEENAEQFNVVRYLSAYVPAESETEASAAAEKAAEILSTMTAADPDAFRTAANAVTGEEASEEVCAQSSFASLFGDDAEAANLESGYTFTHADSNGCYAVYVQELDNNDYSTVSFRHILIEAEDADGDGSVSDAEKQTAYKAVEAIRDEWLSGEATEESFAQLANEKSTDTGSNTNGGLYENVSKDMMVEEINDFLFAEGRAAGDYEICYGETDNYCGYHLVYVSSVDGENYAHYLADYYQRTEDYSKQVQESIGTVSGEPAMLWRYVMK